MALPAPLLFTVTTFQHLTKRTRKARVVMSYGVKLLIPIGLGVMAALFNWLSLASQTQLVDFTMVSRDIPAGSVLSEKDLEKLGIPANQSKGLKKTAVPYDERAALIGEKVLRGMEKNDLVFWQDTLVRGEVIEWEPGEAFGVVVPLNNVKVPPLHVGDKVNFRVPVKDEATGKDEMRDLGPFRLIMVGQKRRSDRSVTIGIENIEQVTVAFPKEKQTHHIQLQEFLDRRSVDDNLKISITAVNSPD